MCVRVHMFACEVMHLFGACVCMLSANIPVPPFQKKQTNLVNCWSSRGVLSLKKSIQNSVCLRQIKISCHLFVVLEKNLEPPMLKSCIFNSPQASKTNCQRQAGANFTLALYTVG